MPRSDAGVVRMHPQRFLQQLTLAEKRDKVFGRLEYAAMGDDTGIVIGNVIVENGVAMRHHVCERKENEGKIEARLAGDVDQRKH